MLRSAETAAETADQTAAQTTAETAAETLKLLLTSAFHPLHKGGIDCWVGLLLRLMLKLLL